MMKYKEPRETGLGYVKSLVLVVLAAALLAANIKTFVRAGNLVPGGLTGLSLVIQRSLFKFGHIKVPYAPINIILNLIPAYIGVKYISKRFTGFSILMIFLSSFMVDLFPTIRITTDPLLICVFGGLLNGLAITIALIGRASSGGTDFVAVFLNRKYNISSWNMILGFNICVLITAGLLFGFEASLYSIIFQFVSTQTIQAFHKSDHQITMFIITNKPKLIEDEMFKLTNHGITQLNAVGAYKHEERIMLFTVISEDELNDATRVIMKCDPHAFINITNSIAVKGKFYQKPL